MEAPALVPPIVTPARVLRADQLRDRRAAEQRRQPSWLPPVKKMPVASVRRCKPARFLAVAARVEIHHVDAPRAEFAEQFFVARPGFVRAARGRDHDDVGDLAAGLAHEAGEDARVVFLVLGAADRHDRSAHFAFRNAARTHGQPPSTDLMRVDSAPMSVRPWTFGFSRPMTLPMSFIVAAPVVAIASRIIASSSASPSWAGR